MSSLKKCKQFIDDNEKAERSLEDGTLVLGPCDERPKKMKASLTEYEWMMIEEILQIMGPSYIQSKKMQAEEFTLTDFYGSWTYIKVFLREYQKRPNNLTNLAEVIISKMVEYEKDLFMNPLYSAALFLHPRFARLLIGRQRIVARTKLSEIYSRIQDKDEPEVNNNACNDINNLEFPDMERAMDSYLDEISDMSSITTSDTVPVVMNENMLALEIEMNDFDQVEIIQWDAKILKYWETQKLRFPKLYLVAQVVLGFPSSQTSVERNFSSLTYILSSLRTQLGTGMLQHILFIRNNKKVFDKVVEMQLASAK